MLLLPVWLKLEGLRVQTELSAKALFVFNARWPTSCWCNWRQRCSEACQSTTPRNPEALVFSALTSKVAATSRPSSSQCQLKQVVGGSGAASLGTDEMHWSDCQCCFHKGRRVHQAEAKSMVTNYLHLAATELKKNGKFKLGDLLNMKMWVWPHQQHHSRLCPDERTVHLRMGLRISLSSS